MMQAINWMEFVKPKKLENNITGNYKDLNLETTDCVRLLSSTEIEDLESQEDRKISATDFALVEGAWQSESYRAGDGLRSIVWWLRSANTSYASNAQSVNIYGDLHSNSVSNSTYAVRPALTLNLKSILQFNIDFGELIHNQNDKQVVELGEYPKTKTTQELSKILENLYNDGDLQEGLECTGRLFTTNGDDSKFLSRQNPEFVYKGEKYVRVISRYGNDGRVFSDGSPVPTNVNLWLKVEPIIFEIKNWDRLPKSINPNSFGTEERLELVPTQGILSGLPFYPDYNHANCNMWQNSLQRCFLNSAKSEELDGNPELQAQFKWDFTNSGFLYQALDMTREPTREYVVPESENAIASYAFAGCVGIEKIIVHDGVKEIRASAFSGLHNTQIELNLGEKDIFCDMLAFKDCSFKYIYLSKYDNKVILAPEADPLLEQTCYRKNYIEGCILNSDSDFVNRQVDKTIRDWLKGNFRRNYVQLNNWKAEKLIKFLPPYFTMKVFPASEMKSYFVNDNHKRWGKLVKTLGFDTLEGIDKNNSLTDLMKIYYAIGGFSENQGESEKAFDYILNYVAKVDNPNATPKMIGDEIHSRFSKLIIKGRYNKTFADFFMKYYKDNPDFMSFRLRDKEGELMDSQDYLCSAHNSFEAILKNYPNRTVNGNEERALLSPRFVAEHSSTFEYEEVDEGNEALAGLVGRYGYSQSQFEKIQNIFNRAKELKDFMVISADKASQSGGITFRILGKDDPLGFVLGDITNCCQRIDDVGGSCVEDGYNNPNAGFLVFEDVGDVSTGEKRIIGQAYIWYDPETKTVCYDNIEIPRKVLKELRKGDKHEDSTVSVTMLLSAIEESAKAIITSMNEKGINVERITTGEGYNDLVKELSECFEKEEPPTARHRSYDGYSDAGQAQYIIKRFDDVPRLYRGNALKNVRSCVSSQNLTEENEG